MLFEQYHLRRLDEAFLLITGQLGDIHPTITGLSPSHRRLLVGDRAVPRFWRQRPTKHCPNPPDAAALTRARRAFPATKDNTASSLPGESRESASGLEPGTAR